MRSISDSLGSPAARSGAKEGDRCPKWAGSAETTLHAMVEAALAETTLHFMVEAAEASDGS